MRKKIQVLLVDDERDFLDPVSFWLNSKGYSVILAHNGQEAIELVESAQPDIVFLDVSMPVMGGLEALAGIRKINPTIPVVMITAYGDIETMKKARQLGISGFFPKKADLVQLTNMLETTLKTHKKLHPSSEEDKQS